MNHVLCSFCQKWLKIPQSKERGKFGRILGVFYKDGETISINQKMIEEGFAVPYTGGNKEELDALHEANKQKLIAKGLL